MGEPELVDLGGYGVTLTPPSHPECQWRWSCAGDIGYADSREAALFWAGWWVGRARLAADVEVLTSLGTRGVVHEREAD